MSQFTEFTGIAPLPKQNLWVTIQEMVWELDEEGSGRFIKIPAGFLFDGATIPKIFGWIAQKVEPRSISGAAGHDYGYVKKTLDVFGVSDGKRVKIGERRFSRWELDRMYRDMLLACGTPKRIAYTERIMLTLFGYPVWAGWIHTT